MAESDRDVTREEIEAIAAKLGPAVESLTDGERQIFAHILERAGGGGDEVAGFAQGDMHHTIKLKMESPAAWANPLSSQLATAAGWDGQLTQKDKWTR